MSNNSKNTSSGVSFFTLLGLLFIGLKLGHVIKWTWPWVLAPLWVPFTITVVILVLILLLAR